MKISKRLNTIADMIKPSSRVIDVGCDHGLLSIYLDLEKNCNCLASDVNSNALENAKSNIIKYNAKRVDTLLTDGIENIDISDDDIIVIAGMGTSTIKHILEDKKLSNTLIISSNNQLYELRKYIISLGYKIEDEKYVLDHQKHYVIIKFIKGNCKYSKLDLQYGPIVKNDNEYLLYELNKQVNIKNRITNSSFIVKFKNKREINKLKKLLKKLEEN